MTREEAINYLEMSMAIGEDDDSRHHNEVLEFIIKFLEQEPVLDKIKAEIERKANSGQWSEPVICGMKKSIAIIDKYKAESEEEICR